MSLAEFSILGQQSSQARSGRQPGQPDLPTVHRPRRLRRTEMLHRRVPETTDVASMQE